jgi:hypothetical protein
MIDKLKPNNINESSLSRVVHHMEKHDCGTITAWRSYENCGDEGDKKYTKSDNKKRNIQLLAILEHLGYDTTNVDGSYVENFGTPTAGEVKEDVYFVVDSKDRGNLKQDLMRLGEQFNQDSILFIPKGEIGMLIGTNHCPMSYPGYGKVKSYGSRVFGRPGEFMTKVRNRPFMFETTFLDKKCNENYFAKANVMGKWATVQIARGDWREIQL